MMNVETKVVHEVSLDGEVIGTIELYKEGGPRSKVARLVGYDNATWIGTGSLLEIGAALVAHELEQRQDNPLRRGTRRWPAKG